ncbi:MmgE/PrpD family protein [Streptomyces sp. NPDC060209]|uniref:MmgE/PrpD family protein n=1 Tax=Streptomyces sp. NPDC060209 TaxID=3347073 RepID=UPI00365C4B5C
MSDTTAGMTAQLAEHAARNVTPSARSRDILAASLADTLGVALAAAQDPAPLRLREALGPRLAPGCATVWASGERCDAPTAALLNGTAAHALDYDDVNDRMSGHPSAVLWPALLAVGESVDARGQDLAAAYHTGFDTIITLATVLDVDAHYRAGWHATATLGVLGATAAVCRLLGLTGGQVQHALGIASSSASGSRQNFGTLTKPLHAGLAARDAVMAARLAQVGFDADPSELDAPLGFLARFGPVTGSAADVVLAEAPHLDREGLNIKSYPSCYKTQRAIDAALKLARERRPALDDIIAIRVTTEPGGQVPLVHHEPANGTQAKFSMEYVVAAALHDKAIDLFSFLDEKVARPDVRALMALVQSGTAQAPPVGSPEWSGAFATVEVTTSTGTIASRCDVPRGDRRYPLNWSEVADKVTACCAYGERKTDAPALLRVIAEANVLPTARQIGAQLVAPALAQG